MNDPTYANISEINFRLTQLWKTLGFKSQNSFAESINISSSRMSNVITGRNKPDLEFIQHIILSHTNVNIDWLLTGQGEVFKKDIAAAPVRVLKRGEKKIPDQAIPLYNIEAAAGLVQLFGTQKPNIIDFIHIPDAPKCDGAIRITGDSMYPLLKSGDIVMYKQVQDIPNGIFFGEMYLLAVDMDGDYLTTVKYLQQSERGPEYVKLVSYNQHHQPKDVLLANIRALALVKISISIKAMS